jgi:hypothetical protein
MSYEEKAMTNRIPEADEVQRFNAALDRVVVGDTSPADIDPEIATIAATLAMPNAASLSRRREVIRARVLKYRSVMRRQQVMRFAASTLVIALAATATYFIVTLPGISLGGFQFNLTPVTYTGDVLGEWDGCVITNGVGELASRATIMAAGSPDPWDVTHTPEPGATEFVPIYPERYDTLTEASEAAGFMLWSPQYVPGGLVLNDIWVDPTGENGVGISYSEPINIMTTEYTSFEIMQDRARISRPGCELTIGDAVLMRITVGGQQAYWIEDRIAGINMSTDELWRGDMLLWEQAGMSFYLTSDDISLSEAQAIAESMSPGRDVGIER